MQHRQCCSISTSAWGTCRGIIQNYHNYVVAAAVPALYTCTIPGSAAAPGAVGAGIVTTPPVVLLGRVVVTAVEPEVALEVAAGAVDIVNIEVVVADVETVTLVVSVVETPRSDKRTTESSRLIYLHAATMYIATFQCFVRN